MNIGEIKEVRKEEAQKLLILSKEDGYYVYTIDLKTDQNHKIFLTDQKPILKGFERYSEDYIITWFYDKFLSLHHLHTGKHLMNFHGHCESVENILILKDGNFLSWADKAQMNRANIEYFRTDPTINIWSPDYPSPIQSLIGHEHFIYGVIEIEGSRVLSWSYDKTIRLWDTKTGEAIHIFTGHDAPVIGVRDLGDGTILSWSKDRSCAVWDVERGERLGTYKGHEHAICRALRLDRELFLSSSVDQSLHIWKLLQKEALQKHFESEARHQIPSIYHTFLRDKSPAIAYKNAAIDTEEKVVYLTLEEEVLEWHENSRYTGKFLLETGTLVIASKMEIECLQLYFGNQKYRL